jgi:hypothetical protein
MERASLGRDGALFEGEVEEVVVNLKVVQIV